MFCSEFSCMWLLAGSHLEHPYLQPYWASGRCSGQVAGVACSPRSEVWLHVPVTSFRCFLQVSLTSALRMSKTNKSKSGSRSSRSRSGSRSRSRSFSKSRSRSRSVSRSRKRRLRWVCAALESVGVTVFPLSWSSGLSLPSFPWKPCISF